MTSISSVTGSAVGQPADSTEPALGKEDFLTLLVAQLQNQDPLNPTDPTEFTAQLAQFSSLEQLIDINSNLDGMSGGAGLMSSVGALGREVTARAEEVEYSGSPLELGYQLDRGATGVTLLVRDDSGNVVRTLEGTELDAGTHFLTWDGKTDSGTDVAQGAYSLSVVEQRGDGSGGGTSLVRSTVTGLENQTSGTELLTDAGPIGIDSVITIQEQSNS
jgi:flagellar basal-body rod modification protein FlgD